MSGMWKVMPNAFIDRLLVYKARNYLRMGMAK
jgi:hypothetical protein